MKIAFRNQNGLRDEKRKLKNGLSPKVTAQVAALDGSTVYGTAKLHNSDGTFAEPIAAQPVTESPDLAKQPPLNTEGKQESDTTHASGHDTIGEGTKGPDDANPASGTPAVGPDGKTITNAKKPLPAFIQKQIDAKKGKDDDDDAPVKKKKVKNSVYPSIKGNYHSALSAMRVKLANSDMGDDEDMLMNDVEVVIDANKPSGQPNQSAATIIYGDQDLTTPAAELVVTTQDLLFNNPMFTDLVNKWAMLNGGPGSGRHKGYASAYADAETKTQKAMRSDKVKDHMAAYDAHNIARRAAREDGQPSKAAFHAGRMSFHMDSGSLRNAKIVNGGPGSGIKGHQTQRGYNDAAKKADMKSFIARRDGGAFAHGVAATAHREASVLAGDQLKRAFHTRAEASHMKAESSARRSSFGLRNSKIGQITYDAHGRITNFIPASIVNSKKDNGFASVIERFKKTPVMANSAPESAKIKNDDGADDGEEIGLMNDSTSPIDATDDAMMNKDVPLAKPVTNPKQATVAEQKDDLKKADEQKAIVNSGTSEGVKKEWLTRKGIGSMNVPEGKIHVNHDAATDHLSIVSEDHNGNRTSQFDQKLDRSSEGKDRTPPTVSYHPESKTIKVQTPKTHQWESKADWSGPGGSLSPLANAQRIVGKAVEIPMEKLANAKFAPASDSWIHIAPYGSYHHGASDINQLINEEGVSSMVKHFNDRKAEDGNHMILLDKDNLSAISNNSEAMGWIDKLEQRPTGLWGHAKFTDVGQDAVSNGRYRFLSPVWNRADLKFINDTTAIPLVCDSVAMTNVPNIGGATPLSV